ncbi:hypothetical protein TWF281_002928 [Arthrobotrys megalospora]
MPPNSNLLSLVVVNETSYVMAKDSVNWPSEDSFKGDLPGVLYPNSTTLLAKARIASICIQYFFFAGPGSSNKYVLSMIYRGDGRPMIDISGPGGDSLFTGCVDIEDRTITYRIKSLYHAQGQRFSND